VKINTLGRTTLLDHRLAWARWHLMTFNSRAFDNSFWVKLYGCTRSVCIELVM
jgi:hypothetical protein